ncbi:MAG TPA: DUF2937 family protein [Opitutaceae bacterium]|nr:DUF2937 family protein [Opitutaceae bacterium]
MPPIIRSVSQGAEGLLDRILCVAGAVLFSQAPEFMQQYLQRLEGHLDEARMAVGKFTDAATQAGMSLDQLVNSASQNPDPAMGKLGGVVHEAVARVDTLAASDAALRGASTLSRPFVFLSHADWGIARATLSIYKPAVPTTFEGMVYSAAGIIVVVGFYHLVIRRPIARHLRRKAAARELSAS